MKSAGRLGLIVDDDPTVLRYFQRGFESAGWEMLLASTVDAGLRLSKARPLVLAVVDLKIGNGWGLDLVPALRATHPALYVVVLSGYVGAAAAAAAIRAGANDVVPKPITAAEFVSRIGTGPTISDMRDAPAPTLHQAKLEHIGRILTDCKGNVSEAARRLGIHRQSLERQLKKRH